MEDCDIELWKNENKTKEYAENQRRIHLIQFNLELRKLTKNKKKELTDKYNNALDKIMDNINNIEQFLEHLEFDN